MILNVLLIGIGLWVYYALSKESQSSFFGVMYVYQMLVLLGVVFPVIGLIGNLIYWYSTGSFWYLVTTAVFGAILLYASIVIFLDTYDLKAKIEFIKFKKMLSKNGWNSKDFSYAWLKKSSGNRVFLNRRFDEKDLKNIVSLMQENGYPGSVTFHVDKKTIYIDKN